MAIRNLADLGPNLRKIMNRLLANQTLVKLLYYTDKDPLSHENVTDEEIREHVFNKLIKIVPRVNHEEIEPGNTVISICVTRAISSDNEDFDDIRLNFVIFAPYDGWIIKDENLRPFYIMGELKNSLNKKKIDGFGRLVGGDFQLSSQAADYAAYTMSFLVTEYD